MLHDAPGKVTGHSRVQCAVTTAGKDINVEVLWHGYLAGYIVVWLECERLKELDCSLRWNDGKESKNWIPAYAGMTERK